MPSTQSLPLDGYKYCTDTKLGQSLGAMYARTRITQRVKAKQLSTEEEVEARRLGAGLRAVLRHSVDGLDLGPRNGLDARFVERAVASRDYFDDNALMCVPCGSVRHGRMNGVGEQAWVVRRGMGLHRVRAALDAARGAPRSRGPCPPHL